MRWDGTRVAEHPIVPKKPGNLTRWDPAEGRDGAGKTGLKEG